MLPDPRKQSAIERWLSGAVPSHRHKRTGRKAPVPEPKLPPPPPPLRVRHKPPVNEHEAESFATDSTSVITLRPRRHPVWATRRKPRLTAKPPRKGEP